MTSSFLSPLLFFLLFTNVLSSTQIEFECECSYSATQKAYTVSMSRTSDTKDTWVGVHESKVHPTCSNAVASSSSTTGVTTTFPTGKSGASYQCVLWQGKAWTYCTQIGITTFTCPLNTTTTTTSNTRRFLNLLIIIPAIFLLTFLVAALVRRLRSRAQRHTHTNSHEYELTPYFTPTSSQTPTHHPTHTIGGGMTVLSPPTHTATPTLVPYTTLAYPVGGGGMAVLQAPYTPMPYVHQPQFVTNVFPVGVPQTNMVYMNEGEVPQLTPLYVATTTQQQRF